MQVGDWGRDGTQNQSAVAALMARVADAVKPDFVLSMGDNFYESKASANMTPCLCMSTWSLSLLLSTTTLSVDPCGVMLPTCIASATFASSFITSAHYMYRSTMVLNKMPYQRSWR